MDSLPLSPDDLKQLIALFEEHRLAELEWREGDLRVRLGTASPKVTSQATELAVEESFAEAYEAIPALAAAEVQEPGPEDKGWHPLHSPMTGTFYRSPGPDEPNFVEVGDQVETDQTFGLIEAMKIFSEILCDTAGMVMEIVAQSGQMVSSGEMLGWIKPN